mmetsp:Transcript_47387/g.112759  ORF Transcript_47387/g.112759 Transcript_47387/m.112759 type:complete len:263 (+) Transcript_47387:809-1597(+)
MVQVQSARLPRISRSGRPHKARPGGRAQGTTDRGGQRNGSSGDVPTAGHLAIRGSRWPQGPAHQPDLSSVQPDPGRTQGDRRAAPHHPPAGTRRPLGGLYRVQPGGPVRVVRGSTGSGKSQGASGDRDGRRGHASRVAGGGRAQGVLLRARGLGARAALRHEARRDHAPNPRRPPVPRRGLEVPVALPRQMLVREQPAGFRRRGAGGRGPGGDFREDVDPALSEAGRLRLRRRHAHWAGGQRLPVPGNRARPRLHPQVQLTG